MENGVLKDRSIRLLKSEKTRVALALFGLTFIRYLYFGFRYAYMLDDYIQYHNYRATGSVGELIAGLGLLSARPLAGLADIIFWTLFWGKMLIAVALITAMFVFGAFLLEKVFARKFGSGNIFLVSLLLTPANFEGVYWMSASTRVVPGFLLASAAIYAFDRFTLGGRKRWFAVSLLLAFLSCGFYEQAGVFAVAGIVLLGLFSIHRMGSKGLLGFASFASLAAYLLVTKLIGSNSVLYAGRIGSIILPSFSEFYASVARAATNQVAEAVWTTSLATIFKGFVRGFNTISASPNGAWILAATALVVCFFAAVDKTPRRISRTRSQKGVLFGVLLAAAPVTLFYVMGNPWFSMRNAFFCFPGIALAFDCIVGLVSKELKFGSRVKFHVAIGLAVFFMIASVSETGDYVATLEDDQQAAAKIISQVEYDSPEQRILIFGVMPSYLDDQNYSFHEHIHGVTESDWALTGALRYYSQNQSYPTVMPVAFRRELYVDIENIASYDLYYMADAELGLTPVSVAVGDDGELAVYNAEGEVVAVSAEQKNSTHIFYEGQSAPSETPGAQAVNAAE